MNEMTISVSDLLAVLIRKGRRILLIAVCFAVLLAGYTGYTSWRDINDSEYLNLELLEYEQELLKLERSIEKANECIRQSEEYISNSIRMQINPYDKHTAEIYLAITGIDEKSIDMTFGDNTTPIEYLTEQVVTQYQILWAAQDLPSVLGIEEYENILDKYVREMVFVQSLGSGILGITAYGRDEAESVALADAACKVLTGLHSSAQKHSYPHNINSFDRTQQSQIDPELANFQIAQHEVIDNYNDSIITAEKAIKRLNPPDGIVVASIKMGIIGGLLGVIFACVWYGCKILIQGQLQSTAHGEKAWNIPAVGTLIPSRGMFNRMANWVSGERVWEEEDQAIRYIEENVNLRKKGDHLLLVSSQKGKKENQSIQKLQKAMSKSGINVMVADDFSHDPDSIAMLGTCDCVVLFEILNESKLEEISKILKFAQECGKPVVGFITV